MNKHRTHQIDDLAQRVFRNAIPTTWVSNEQTNDYGKDFLVEIGDENGDLTGSSFYVQLKGQQRTSPTSDGHSLNYSLETKYAVYYVDKIKDLPVFLVLIDCEKRQGWWLFLQEALHAEQNWRNRRSLTLKIPKSQQISETDLMRGAIEAAKKWLRLEHSESIQDAVASHKKRMIRMDPRFDVSVSLINDVPQFSLQAKEPVSLKVHLLGEPTNARQKLDDLINKGKSASFEAGELKVEGSGLFESIEKSGCILESEMKLPATLTLTSWDQDGKELARLSDVSGHFRGGRKEQWFSGGLDDSPFSVRLGPITEVAQGSIAFNLSLNRWEGQQLLYLAYFEQLHTFFRSLPRSTRTNVEFQYQGNSIFSVTVNMYGQTFAEPFAKYLETIWMARRIAERFKLNLAWSPESNDQEVLDSVRYLHAMLFEGGVERQRPHIIISAELNRKATDMDLIRKGGNPRSIRLVSTSCQYPFFNKLLDVGALVMDYSSMSIKIIKKPMQSKRKVKTQKPETTKHESEDEILKVEFIATKSNIETIREK